MKTHSALLDKVQVALLEPEKNKLKSSRQITGGSSDLATGESIVRGISGSGAINLLRVKVGAPDMMQAMRSVVISISFDDKERVLVPVGEFFGSGPGLNPFKGWWRQVQSDGWMQCWWPMPFKRNATIKIINDGSTEVSAELADIGTTNWQWTDRTMYFNSSWRSENNMDTGNVVDWNYLTVEGKGVYVGDTLALFNNAKLPHPSGTGTWWGNPLFPALRSPVSGLPNNVFRDTPQKANS